MGNTESNEYDDFTAHDRLANVLMAICLISAAGAVVCGVLSLMGSF